MPSLRRRIDGILSREAADGVLLLDTRTQHVHQLNQTAAFIWQACEEAPSVAELAARLALEFDVDEDTAKVDVNGTLDKLRELDLVIES
jgi:PqqD family protein of HPr-rel-A system